MPTPARTSIAEIVLAGRRILEAEGLDALTMQAVANAVGVRAPSLYKRVRGRAELVHLVANDVAISLAAHLDAAARRGHPRHDLRAMANAHRAFARANPRAYGLLFAPLPEDWRVDADLNARVSAVVIRATAALAGEQHALEAARTVVAWAHGFVTMELADAFRLGSDVDAAFAYGIDRITTAIDIRPEDALRVT